MLKKKKPIFRKAIISFLAGVTVFWFCGCERTNHNAIKKDIFAMDTYMTITAYGNKAKDALKEAEKSIKQIEKIFSVTDKDSEVYQINQKSASESENISGSEVGVEISDELAVLIKTALEMGQATDWDFDISIYPVLRAWGFTTQEYYVPSSEEINALLGKVGGENITLTKKDEKYYLSLPAGMLIDFGGIAKGYAADLAADMLKEKGVESAILSLGGNIQTLGEKPDGSKWNIAIKDPKNTDKYAGVLQIGEGAVVTSGGYERYFTDDTGHMWSHIINPENGYPAETDLLSVSIIGTKGSVCDALSTALYIKGLDEAIKYWKEQGGFEAIFITKEQEVYVTEGIKDKFDLLGDYKDKKISVIENR